MYRDESASENEDDKIPYTNGHQKMDIDTPIKSDTTRDETPVKYKDEIIAEMMAKDEKPLPLKRARTTLPADHPVHWDERYRIKYKQLDCILRTKTGLEPDDGTSKTVMIDNKEFIVKV